MFSFLNLLLILMGFGITIYIGLWVLAVISCLIHLRSEHHFKIEKGRYSDLLFESPLITCIILDIFYPVFSLPILVWIYLTILFIISVVYVWTKR